MEKQQNALSDLVTAAESLNCSAVTVFMWGPGVCGGGVCMRSALRTYRNTTLGQPLGAGPGASLLYFLVMSPQILVANQNILVRGSLLENKTQQNFRNAKRVCLLL